MIAAKIGSFAEYPDPFFVDQGIPVQLNPIALKSVGFIGVKTNDRFRPRATCFFVRYSDQQHFFDHLVTAEHVISGLLTKGHDIWVRLNTKDGKVIEAKADHQAFRFHPDNETEATDVAVCPFSSELTDDETGQIVRADIGFMHLNGGDEGGFLPTKAFAEESIGLGSEIAVVGLFRSHFGKNRNVPIVRVGNISAMPGEPIFTRYAGYMKAYLVETRSIAGLSGSPVVVFPNEALMLARGLSRGGRPDNREQAAALLGLMHGHFDVANLNEDVVIEEDQPERSVHTGIGIVIPVEKIVETINHPDFVAMRKDTVDRLRAKQGATADIAPEEEAPPAKDENPRHREDFTSLLGKAARTPLQDD